MFTIKIERDKPHANFASALAGPQLAVQRQSGDLLRSHCAENIEQATHQGALLLHDTPPAMKLRPSKNHAGTRFLSRLSRLVISRWKITRLLPAPCKVIQFQLNDKLILVSGAAPSRARETRCTESCRLSSTAIPPPALTCPGTSDDRPDLRADNWTAPCTAEPVAAAAIGLVVGSFAGAGAAMRSNRIARQQKRKN